MVDEIGIFAITLQRREVMSLRDGIVFGVVGQDRQTVMRFGVTGVIAQHSLIEASGLVGSAALGLLPAAPKILSDFGGTV